MIDESYQDDERRAGDRPEDLHVVPEVGPEHESSVECWCVPKLAHLEGTARVWTHRLMS